MKKPSDLISRLAADFDQSFQEPASDAYKRSISFYFSFYNHAYIKAIADSYGISVAAVGEQFFEPLITSIFANLPEARREDIANRAWDLQINYLNAKDLNEDLAVDWSDK